MKLKAGIRKYVDIVKRLFVAFSCVAIPAIMVSLVFAFMRYIAFCILAPVLIAAYLAVYGVYALKVSMGTVIGVDVREQTVNLITKRKTFTYDLKAGCVSFREKKNKFVAVFQTQDSRDKFVFLRRAPFSRYYEEQFTREEMSVFCPQARES